MSHETGRERHMIYRCDHCGNKSFEPLIYVENDDEHWCRDCMDAAAEAVYEREQERLMEDGGPPSLLEQQIAAWRFK